MKLATDPTSGTAAMTLSSMHASPRCEFWPDSISYTAANLNVLPDDIELIP